MQLQEEEDFDTSFQFPGSMSIATKQGNVQKTHIVSMQPGMEMSSNARYVTTSIES